jgi:hypothetical protein
MTRHAAVIQAEYAYYNAVKLFRDVYISGSCPIGSTFVARLEQVHSECPLHVFRGPAKADTSRWIVPFDYR